MTRGETIVEEQFDPILALGLMSGTSADGVDAALVRTDGQAAFESVDAMTLPYSKPLRGGLLEAAQTDVPLDQVLALEQQLTELHVVACRKLLGQAGVSTRDIRIIGFHGHTIRHDASRRLTWQLGDASLLSAKLGCNVVSDFRRRDIAAGGQGAPLAPLFHQQLFVDHAKPIMVLNLGGVANITFLGEDGQIWASDTGPGCGLLDSFAQRHLGVPYDRDGELAASGRVHTSIVEDAMKQSFFHLPIPKSADRFEFDHIDIGDLSPADGAATLCAITVAGVAVVVAQLPSYPASVWVTGGGSRHPIIMSMLRDELRNVQGIESAGFRSDSFEAECFAWLAVRRLRQLPTSVPATTGCERPTCGGCMTGNVCRPE